MTPTPGPIPGTLGPAEHQDPSFLMSPRKSMTVSTKGLLNMPGQNNCFLNSAVQVLWHLDTFRRNFRELSGHACMAESCIFCALKELFTQFQYSQESALPPDALRHALAKTFCDQRRFQLGFMDDAAECFENILLRIHVHIANQEADDMCGNVNCIPHQKFAMTLVEQRICLNCGATSEPLPFTQMVHYVTTSALCAKSVENQEQDPNCRTNSFGKFLRLAGDMGEVRECPSGCGSKIQVKKTLMNHPEVVSIGLVWDSECPTLQHITDVFHSIGMYLRLQDMFHYVFDVEWASATSHQLVGVVTYYGKHYSTFFFHTKLRVWIYFDDATVREVGPSWEQVVEKCQRGRFQPLLLLFANTENSVDASKRSHSTLCASYFNDPKTSVDNQRQAVIKQYLMFQNSYPNTNEYKKNTDIHYSNPILEPYPYSLQRTGDVSPSHNNHYANLFPYNHCPPNNNQHPPVYSNLQYLNTLQYKQEPADISKLNEVSLPAVMPLPIIGPRNNLQPVDSKMYNIDYEMHNKDKKDFDGAKDSDSAFTEEDPDGSDMYISRKAVENVLNLQKRQMSLSRSYSQSSVGNRNSNSSLESFDTINTSKLGPIKNQMPETVPNRRDSGSWSSDRNSSSSNNSVENPFLTVVASKRLLLGLNKKAHLPDYSNTNTSDHGYDSYSVSSSDSYPSVNGSPVKLDPRLTQIPEDWQPEDDSDLDKKLKLITEDCSGPPDCDKLCAEADLLLAKSHEKEKDGDLVMAALLCDSAAARARAAMEAPYNNSKSLVSAKMKHSTCVMRSSNLYRRLKDHEMDERRKQKNHSGHHSRQSSRDSTHSRHSRQGSKDSTHSKSGGKDSNHNSDDAENFGKNIEIYGTLPKKGSRKKVSTNSSSTKAKDDQVYKDFLDKQRKNTSLSNSLNETMQKNVDNGPTRLENNTKIKTQANTEKSHRKSITEGIPPKSPTRKKLDTPPRSEVDGRKRVQKITEPSFQGLFPDDKINGFETNSRDLLSPISSPDKKQHKIKRKLMGGFMKRKNRSLPDLREDQDLSDPMDTFLDDAIIQVPSKMMLPNGKSKKIEAQTDSSIGNMTRGFHQPHHAFVKKDLTQRPLLMKVNPPNIQSPLLSSPKSKLIHTLPSIPKKPQESNSRLEPGINMNTKPSKIPFISKAETANLPPLNSFKSNEAKCLPKPGFLNKTSAIPVLTPQISLSPIKTSSISKNDAGPEVCNQPSEQSGDKEELPQPSNPFLAEIQAKRKQVLNKSTQKVEPPQTDKNPNSPIQANESKELSLLPKLAALAEGTSWLKELQSKQQQILKKQDISNNSLPKTMNTSEKESPKMAALKANENTVESNRTVFTEDAKNWKLLSEESREAERASFPQADANSNKTTNSVKDLASRFEKVLIKPKEMSHDIPSEQLSSTANNKKQSCTNEVKESIDKMHMNKPPQMQNTAISGSNNTSTNSVLPLKSALKSRPDYNQNNDTVDSRLQNTVTVAIVSPVQNSANCMKSAMKQDTPVHLGDSLNSVNNSNVLPLRPMQPPDYATAMQRLELIRTSTSEVNLNSLTEHDSKSPAKPSDAPKKKSGVKKTVTFSDEIVLVACAEYDEIDFSSNPLFERVYQQHVESGKGEIPILSNSYGNPQTVERNRFDDSTENLNATNSNVLNPCNLCHSKHVSSPNTYCTDCEFYLSRFKP